MQPKPRTATRPEDQPMRLLFASAAMLFAASTAHSQTIYPIDRAEILAGAKFDFKVEFPGKISAQQMRVTVNGAGAGTILGGSGEFVEREDGKDQSAFL